MGPTMEQSIIRHLRVTDTTLYHEDLLTTMIPKVKLGPANSKDNIFTNVQVKESETWDNQQISIRVIMKATSPKLLEAMEQTIDFDEKQMLAKSTVQIKKSFDKEMKKRLLRDNCAHADIQIEYPRVKSGATVKALRIEVMNGEVALKMHPNRIETIFEKVILELANGDMNIQNLAVSRSTELKVINGYIHGSLKTAGDVRAATVNGPINLAIDTTPLGEGWNAEENFDLRLNALNGPIDVSLAKPFYGAFTLKTGMGKLAIALAESIPARINYTTQKWNELTGTVSKIGQNDNRSLSRIEIESLNGGSKLDIQDKKT
ncbi:hypothetical protein BGX28_006823 [Mortierella sp. GBA30]|nr:hypothetical protein BGX28_006823 [Mortierella sp. GBA30]